MLLLYKYLTTNRNWGCDQSKYICRNLFWHLPTRLLSIFLLINFFSCTREIEVTLPSFEIKPVVNCLFTPMKPFNVRISLPGIPTDTTFTFIDNAIVTISGDNGSKYLLKYNGNGFYTDKVAIPISGITYTLNVFTPNYSVVSAVDKIPLSASKFLGYSANKEIEASEVLGTGESGKKEYQHIFFRFTNDLLIDDYIGISILTRTQKYIWRGKYYVDSGDYTYYFNYVLSQSPRLLPEGLEKYDVPYIFLFKDKLMTEKMEVFDLKVYSENKETLWMKYYNYSPICYEYIKSLIIHNYTKNYDFWDIYEPMPLLTNINNGYGIFAGYSTLDYTISANKSGDFNQ